jgi:hypothetical protein
MKTLKDGTQVEVASINDIFEMLLMSDGVPKSDLVHRTCRCGCGNVSYEDERVAMVWRGFKMAFDFTLAQGADLRELTPELLAELAGIPDTNLH